MPTSYAVLGILGQRPSYGYSLKRAYDSLYGREKPLAFGQVYATLARLLRDGRITAKPDTKPSAGPERKLYAITAKGYEDVEAWLKRAEELHPGAQSMLFAKVVSAILLDKKPNEYLDIQRAAHLQKMRELTALRRKADLAQALQADYSLFHLEADLRWIDITSARLQTLKEEIVRE